MLNPSFISVYDNLCPDELCDRVIARHKELEESGSWAPYGHSDGASTYGTDQRMDSSFFFHITDIPLTSEINAVLTQGIEKYFDEYPGLRMFPVEMYSSHVKVQKTPPRGGFHRWHCEAGSGESNNRKIVWMIYLNDVEDGEGTTEFLEQGVILKPKKGSVVFFPSSWTHMHRGNPVYSGDKYIATGWYYNH